MKKLKCIQILCFLVILALAAGYAFHCYSDPKNYITRSYEAFYDEPKDTIDGVVFGTSVALYGWTPPAAWQEYGMPVYQLASTVQPFGPLPALIDFVRSRQDIKYVIIDIHALRTKAIKESVRPGNFRKASSSLHFGRHRYRALRQTIDYTEKIYDYYGMPKNPDIIIDTSDISLYVPFLNFHNRWIDGLQKEDYVAVPSEFKGAMDGKGPFRQRDVSDKVSLWEKSPLPLDTFQKEILDGFFNYLQEQDLDVLFVNYPSFNTKKELRQLKGIARYIQDNHYPMLDLCNKEIATEAALNPRIDFRDEHHVNSLGAYKATRYICSYIKDNFYYKDHRGDSLYESWDQAVIDYNNYVEDGWAEKDMEFTTYIKKSFIKER